MVEGVFKISNANPQRGKEVDQRSLGRPNHEGYVLASMAYKLEERRMQHR